MEHETIAHLPIVTFLASLIATFFATLAGGGGGLILLPLLLLIGFPYPIALSIHKVAMVSMGTGSFFRYKKEKLIDSAVFWWTVLIGTPLVILGAYLSTFVTTEKIKPIIGVVVLLLIAINITKEKKIKHTQYKRLNKKRGLIGGLILSPIAFYSGAVGGGSGLFTTFLYLYYLKYSQIRANAMTMLANGLVWNAVGAFTLIFMGKTYWPAIPPLVAGALLGSYIGAHIGIKAGNTLVRWLFLVMSSATAIVLIYPSFLKLIGQ